MSQLKIAALRYQDLPQARRFALEGMHFNRYTQNKGALYLYSQYALCSELAHSTLALGAYRDNQLVGFLCARCPNQTHLPLPPLQQGLVTIGRRLENLGLSGRYQQVNHQLLMQFPAAAQATELTYFAVAPHCTGQGVGSRLLKTLEQLISGQSLYLFTDSECDYAFYFKKGFKISGRQDIPLAPQKSQAQLTCFLLYKNY